MIKTLVIPYSYSIEQEQMEMNTDKGLENAIEYKICQGAYYTEVRRAQVLHDLSGQYHDRASRASN